MPTTTTDITAAGLAPILPAAPFLESPVALKAEPPTPVEFTQSLLARGVASDLKVMSAH
jgi:hypothetical protein